MNIDKIMKEKEHLLNKKIEINGWVRNHRPQKEFGFIDLSDGTNFKHLQVVYDKSVSDFDLVSNIHNGSSIKVMGILQKSEGKNQDIELKAMNIQILGDCSSDYPLQAKRHSMEFLRSIAYLRPRANLFQAVFKIRSLASMAIHEYFQKRGYIYLHAPLITASDCEGAGEMFQVTTLDLEKEKTIDYQKDFFGKKTGLTVSGQLQAETFAMAFSKVYTFGPTFRAENSNTKVHASEFWMIEPEIAFCDIDELMNIEEDFLKNIIQYVLEHGQEELQFLDKFTSPGLIEKLNNLLQSQFTKITHEEVITLLKKAPVKWEFTPSYGKDIAKEHEKYLTEYFKGPVFITNWPKDIKAFYMKLNDDGKTVAAVDLIVPEAGELMGGSQREEDYDKLLKRMQQLNMNIKELQWYLNLRKYGSVIHSGFGMGFERLLMYLTGIDNIRDVIAYPRTPGNCEF